MSQKHHQRTRAQKLERRSMKGICVVRVPRGTVLQRDRLGRMKIAHANPHVTGAKEQARAQRCYMQAGHGAYGAPRSAPTMCQMSKREFEMRVEAERDARYG